MALIDNLIAYYSLEGDSTDASGNGNNGTDTSITYNSSYGKIGQGALFNGATPSRIVLPSGAYIPSNFTFSAWIKPTTLTPVHSEAVLFSSWDGTHKNLIVEQYNSTIVFYNGNGGTSQDTALTGVALTTAWQHLVVVRARTSHIIYLDGEQVATQTGLYSGGTGPSLILGCGSSFSAGYGFSGDIDEVGIWSRALTSDEVSQLYNGGVGLAYPLTIFQGLMSFSGPTIGCNLSGGGSAYFESPNIAAFISGGASTSFSGPYISTEMVGGGEASFDGPDIEANAIGGGHASFIAPDIPIDIWYDTGRMSFKAPKITPAASGGGYSSFKAPREQVNISGTVSNSGNMSFAGPRIKVNISGTVDTIGWMSFPGPKINVNITGNVGTVGSMSFPAPKIKVNVSGYTTSGDVSFPGPGMQVNMSGGLVHNYGVLKYIKGQIR